MENKDMPVHMELKCLFLEKRALIMDGWAGIQALLVRSRQVLKQDVGLDGGGRRWDESLFF